MADKRKVSKRSKPSYFMSILGVSVVLFLLGIIGWLLINTRSLVEHLKSNVEVSAYLRDPLKPADSAALTDYVKTRPYVDRFEFITKAMAKKRYIADGNEDWGAVLDQNPLPQSIDFKLKRDYVQADSLLKIKADLEGRDAVTEVKYPATVVGNMKIVDRVNIGLLILALVLLLSSIVLIDNTIKLAMYSNRFTIKTMQMVGATRWFIVKPLDTRAIVNGAVSGLIAIGGIYLLINFAKDRIPDLRAIDNPLWLGLLFAGLLVLGMLITLVSTHTSVMKYLKKKLDDLYERVTFFANCVYKNIAVNGRAFRIYLILQP